MSSTLCSTARRNLDGLRPHAPPETTKHRFGHFTKAERGSAQKVFVSTAQRADITFLSHSRRQFATWHSYSGRAERECEGLMGLLKVSRQEIGACVERIEQLHVGDYTVDEAWECLEAVLPTLVKLSDGAHLALAIRDLLANGEPQQAADLLRVAPRHRSFTTFLVSV